MVKINLPDNIESWYLHEIGIFFKKNKYTYKKISCLVKTSLGISYKDLLTAKPSELEKIAQSIKKSPPINLASDRTIFISLYENFRSRVISKKYLAKVNLKVCPYCNRNYIFNFGNKKQEATAQLDHFYDKSSYPYFSLSLYNLVPSCSTCNLRKSKKDVLNTPIYNPFEDNLHNHVSFKSNSILSHKEIKKKSIDFFSEERIELKLDITCDASENKTKEHIDTFNINPLYESHKDIIAELYQKRIIYSNEYLDDLFSQFGEDVFESRDELLRLITCGYIEDDELNQRPLSKLIKDISKELGLI